MRARTLLRLILIAQGAAALAVAWGLVSRAGWSVGAALAASIAIAALVRLLINLNNFVLAARFANAVPPGWRLGLRARLRLIAREFGASMLATHWHMLRAAAPMRVHPGSTRVPVVLVHGYGASGGYWAHLAPLLDAARISHLRVDLEPVDADIDAYAPLIEAAVEQLRAATGAARVAIVAHSMGGLAARAWMRAYGTARLARLITLGSPHHGTALARFGPGANAAQMRRAADGQGGSAWLRALAGQESAADRALITSIYSHHDNIVAPQDSSVLEGSRNIAFGGVGHVALGLDARVLAAVLGELEMLSCAAPDTKAENP
jgi:triacylglycerol esterase/lipase EstA (alpha/beta hydrolase family)